MISVPSFLKTCRTFCVYCQTFVVVSILFCTITVTASDDNTVAFDSRSLDVDMDAYLSQHDIVFLSPATEGYEGVPLGNGDLGLMAWTPKRSLHMQINKCDTWDDGPDEPFNGWDDSHHANAYTALRHCGELDINPGLPLFDWMYLKDFQGHLSLANAKASWSAESDLGQVQCSAFVARDPAVMVIEYQDELVEKTTRKVKLARWGTRAFEHWYATLKRDNYLGPEGTQAGTAGDEIWIVQPTRSLHFAIVARIVADNVESKIYNSREAGFEIESTEKCRFTLYLSVVTSEQAADPLAAARENVRKAAQSGVDILYAGHKDFWKNFWSKSFIELPDKYLENLWYFNLYQIGSSSTGRYPPHFIQSIWSWTRDARPWNHCYQWNQQSYTWPLLAGGHPELLEPYAKWRLEGLPHAMEDAQNVHQCRGAFYSDIANRRGYQDVIAPDAIEKTVDTEWLNTYFVRADYNLAPGGQIAHDLYRHYQYTGDEKFLKTYTWPIMREWVIFMLDYVRLEADGRYHVPICDPYETPFVRCKDPVNILAYIKLIFPIYARLADQMNCDKELSEKALEVSQKLIDYTYLHPSDEGKTDSKNTSPSPMMAVGLDPKTEKPIVSDGGFRDSTLMTPVFPTGLIGLDQKNSKEFHAIHNVLVPFIDGKRGPGHNTYLIAMARMGLADHMEEMLHKWVDDYQIFPQGFFFYFERGGNPVSDHLHLENTNRVKVIGKEEYLDIPARPFSHIALEAGSIYEAAVSDMLLSGYSENIRVFPGTPPDWDALFKLHAVGGFEITSEKKGPDVKYIIIKSKLGKRCCVVNPWPLQEKVRVRDITNDVEVLTCSAKQFKFETQAGHAYLIENTHTPLSSYPLRKLTAQPNGKEKHLQRAQLGKPRQF